MLAAGALGLDDRPALVDRGGHRHGAGHVLAGLEPGQALAGVVGDGRVDVDGVDLGIGQHVVELRVALGDAERVAQLVELLLAALADGVHLGLRMVLIDGNELGPKTQTHDRHANLLLSRHDHVAWLLFLMSKEETNRTAAPSIGHAPGHASRWSNRRQETADLCPGSPRRGLSWRSTTSTIARAVFPRPSGAVGLRSTRRPATCAGTSRRIPTASSKAQAERDRTAAQQEGDDVQKGRPLEERGGDDRLRLIDGKQLAVVSELDQARLQTARGLGFDPAGEPILAAGDLSPGFGDEQAGTKRLSKNATGAAAMPRVVSSSAVSFAGAAACCIRITMAADRQMPPRRSTSATTMIRNVMMAGFSRSARSLVLFASRISST